jgi:hypothetical protein
MNTTSGLFTEFLFGSLLKFCAIHAWDELLISAILKKLLRSINWGLLMKKPELKNLTKQPR